MDKAVFRLDGVSRRHGDVVALDRASLVAGEDEYIAVLGPSGAGKTTLLRVIAGFDAPDSGRVFLEGRDITDLPAHERGIGFVFQNFALFPHLSVLANVGFGLRFGRKPAPEAEIDRRAREMIALVGLKGMEDRGVDQISGGQRQRVALARTLAMQPRLVLLDEPLGALDANLRARMRSELRGIRERLGVTFVHVTGSETEALAMGDRVVVLSRGQILQTGRPEDIYDRPQTPDVAHFLNRFNMFEGRLGKNGFEGPFGRVPVMQVRPSDRDIYAVRYDRIRSLPPDAAEGGPALKATYIASEYLGSAIVNFFETEGGQVVEMEHHLSLGPPPQFTPRQQCSLTWDPREAIVFGREAA